MPYELVEEFSSVQIRLSLGRTLLLMHFNMMSSEKEPFFYLQSESKVRTLSY